MDNKSWTVETVFLYFQRAIDDLTQRMEERIASVKEAAMAASTYNDKAFIKAENATDKRFDDVNDQRMQLAERLSKTISRSEADVRDQSFRNITDALRTDLSTVKDDLRKEIADLRESRSEGKGKGIGLDKGWAYLVAAISLVIALISFFRSFIK